MKTAAMTRPSRIAGLGLVALLMSGASALAQTTERDLQRRITALKLSRALAPAPRSATDEAADARVYAQAYFSALPIGVCVWAADREKRKED